MHGVITMNDLVEQLIGDFSTDEHTEGEDPDIVQIGTDEEPRWLIKGDAMLSDVNDELKLNLSREDSDTFGGYIFSLLELIPKDGETPTLETDGLIINVTAIKDHQVVSAEVKVLPKPEDGEE
jgi:CBS domain containing-hemolysin-like protein